MLTAYTSTTDIDFRVALEKAKGEFPEIDFSNVDDALSLEATLLNAQETLYVDVDNSIQAIKAINDAAILEIEITKSLDVMECELEPPVFTDDDLNIDLCEIPEDFPPTPEVDADDISKLEEELKDITDGQDQDAQKMLDCKTEMEEITIRINVLLEKERLSRNTMVSLEESLYNHRVMESFYKKRLDELGRILGTFNPLIERKRTLDDLIGEITISWTTAKDDYLEIDSKIKTGSYTNQQYNDWVNKEAYYLSLNQQRQNLIDEKATIENTLNYEKSQISEFINEYLTTYGTDIERKIILMSSLQALFYNVNDVYSSVASFSTRCEIKPDGEFYDPLSPGTPFKLNIKHRFVDELGILNGRPKTYTKNQQSVGIDLPAEGETPHGSLYDNLYNIWGDVDKFFTRQERGLTDNSNYAAADLQGTGAEKFNDDFIANVSAFRNFYENFVKRWEAKVASVKRNIIEPALKNTVFPLESFAVQEIRLILAFGQAYEILPSDPGIVGNLVAYIRNSSSEFMARINELKSDYLLVQNYHTKVLKDIDAERSNYSKTSCSQNSADSNQVARNSAGTDPLGASSLKQTDPSNPNMTKWCYWTKFSAFVTAVGILPLPGNGTQYRYWPIGLVVPNPSGIPSPVTKIPLPIIWIPIAVIPLVVGVFVIYIAQCGLCPSPVVFYVGPNGEKKFIISLRPGTEFGHNAEDLPAIKLLERGGISVLKGINETLNEINVPNFKPILNPDGQQTILEDIKATIIKKINKIENPDMSFFDNIGTGSSVETKKKAFLDASLNHLNKMELPSFQIPKNGSKVNPKVPPIKESLDQLKKLTKMQLPSIAIPPTSTINIKQKILGAMKKINLDDIQLPVIQNPQLPEEISKFTVDTKAAFKKISDKASKYLVPAEVLGLVALAENGITFFNPYKCKTDVQGISIPPPPPAFGIGVAAINQVMNSTIDSMTYEQIIKMGPLTVNNIVDNLISSITNSIPDVNIPNPSKISIKDMMTDSVKKVAKIQLPSLPDPKTLIQPRIVIPGISVKEAINASARVAISKFPINDINFDSLSGVDFKQILISIVETSFNPLEDFLNPFLNVINIYQDSKDKTFAEIIGMSKISPDTSKIPIITKQLFDEAILLVEKLSIAPYPAVAYAPSLFKNMHPILNHDELPPWERLTLDNFLFVVFADEWCKQGKKTCGFFENPLP